MPQSICLTLMTTNKISPEHDLTFLGKTALSKTTSAQQHWHQYRWHTKRSHLLSLLRFTAQKAVSGHLHSFSYSLATFATWLMASLVRLDLGPTCWPINWVWWICRWIKMKRMPKLTSIMQDQISLLRMIWNYMTRHLVHRLLRCLTKYEHP